MKRIISILLTTVLLMSCITLTAFAAGTQNPTITGANVEIPYGTTTAAVTFSVSEITYQDYGMWIVFDDGLTVSKVKVGPASESPEDAYSIRTFGYNPNTNLVATMGSDELTTSGVLFTVTFNVPANAAVGTSYDVSVKIDTVRNDANEYLTVDVVSGSITIVCNEHKWDNGSVTKEPCCHELGEKTFKCTNNGCTGTKTEPVSATGEHTWDDGVVTTKPSCYKPGVMTFTCKVNGCTQTRTEEIPATEEHIWDGGTVTTKPGHGVTGVKTYKCTNSGCTATKTEDIPEISEHDWDLGVVTKNPSCWEKGVKTFTCSICEGTRTEDIPATGNHVWDNGTVTKNPGCDSTGVKTYKCTTVGCTESWTEDIPATGIHEFDKENGVYGYDDDHHWLICSCGELGAKEDHIWKWVVDKKPTTAEFGSKHEECEICGHKRNMNTPVDKLEEGKDDVPQTGDITPYIVMSFVILLALIVTAAYTLKRKFAK